MPAPERLPEFEAAALPVLPDLYRTATALLRNETEAQDVVQEVYLHAWNSFGRFETGTNCRAWMFKILFHRIHHHRRKWYRLRLFQENEEFLEEQLTAPEEVATRLTDKDVLGALETLPPEYREVVLLADVEEFTYREVSEMLSIPIGTVMSRLSRARGRLRTRLAETAERWGIGRKERPA